MVFFIYSITFLIGLVTIGKNVETVDITRFNRQSPNLQRVVTDIENIYDGVPVDFRYNESDTTAVPQFGGLLSVPGCPKSVDGYPWVYYGSSPVKCYLAGEKGPCGPEQKLFIEFGSPYGFCNCECFEGLDKDKRNKNSAEFCTTLADRREYAFVWEIKKCFALFDQGPCKSNEWLVKETGNRTVCRTRQCPDGQIPYYEEEEKGVDVDVMGNNPRNFSCFSPYSVFAGPVSIVPHDCEADGMKYSKLLKKCVKKFGFNFG